MWCKKDLSRFNCLTNVHTTHTRMSGKKDSFCMYDSQGEYMCNRAPRQEMYDPRRDSGLLYNLPSVSGNGHCQGQVLLRGNFGYNKLPVGEMFTVRASQWRDQKRTSF